MLGVKPRGNGLLARHFENASFTSTHGNRNWGRRHAFKTLQLRASLDPYRTLGVHQDADEKEIKAAHRRLVRQHHPDIAQDIPGTEMKFLAIQEAYEILIGKRRGKEVDSGPASGWDFHDWYWKFSMSRRKGGATSPPPPPPEATRQQWQSQLSGLRAKAAAKKRAASPSTSTNNNNNHTRRTANNPSDAASSSVWRSTTKNARTTAAPPPPPQQQPPLQRVKESNVHQKLHATMAPLDHPVGEHHHHMDEEQEEQPLSSSFSSSSSTTSSAPTIEDTDHPEQQQQHWRLLLTKAVDAVHDLRHRHEHQVNAHAQKIQSHIASIGSKLSQRLNIQDLHSFSGTDDASNRQHDIEGNDVFEPFAASSRWPRTPLGFAGVPSEHDLQAMFSEAIRSMQQSTQQLCDDPSEYAEYSYPGDTHSRKFADRDHVKTRLGSQLTGLKRRASMKRDVEKC